MVSVKNKIIDEFYSSNKSFSIENDLWKFIQINWNEISLYNIIKSERKDEVIMLNGGDYEIVSRLIILEDETISTSIKNILTEEQLKEISFIENLWKTDFYKRKDWLLLSVEKAIKDSIKNKFKLSDYFDLITVKEILQLKAILAFNCIQKNKLNKMKVKFVDEDQYDEAFQKLGIIEIPEKFVFIAFVRNPDAYSQRVSLGGFVNLI